MRGHCRTVTGAKLKELVLNIGASRLSGDEVRIIEIIVEKHITATTEAGITARFDRRAFDMLFDLIQYSADYKVCFSHRLGPAAFYKEGVMIGVLMPINCPEEKAA